MDFSMFRWKRPIFDGYEERPWFCKKTCLASLRTLWHKQQRGRTSCGHPWTCEACATRRTNLLFKLTSSWANAQNSGMKVLEYLKFNQATNHFFLDDSVNSKFLQFHHDITDECGEDDKQHSWAVIERQEEIIMYGPYYPNYGSREHSEDLVISQTQELLESVSFSEDVKVYIFTVNSPCLARYANPCMLNLVRKALEWWNVFGVKTHIGYMKCWGFKGTRENLFQGVNYKQVECVNQTVDYESYVKAAEMSTDLNPLSQTVFSLLQRLLRSQQENIHFAATMQKQDRKTYFKGMHSIFESKPEREKKILTQKVNALIDSAEVLLSMSTESLREYLERGRVFALGYTFSSQACDAGLQDQMRLAFQQCWRDLIQDKCAEFIREKLTEDFNHCALQLFIKDTVNITEQFLQIGKLRGFKGSMCF